MVKSRDEKYPRVVFCDMTRANLITVEASEVTSTASKLRSGFQRTFGNPGNLKHFVAFDVSLRQVLISIMIESTQFEKKLSELNVQMSKMVKWLKDEMLFKIILLSESKILTDKTR